MLRVKWGMGIKERNFDEYQVLHVSEESLNSAPEITPYANNWN